MASSDPSTSSNVVSKSTLLRFLATAKDFGGQMHVRLKEQELARADAPASDDWERVTEQGESEN
ncbi:MAG: hypothetical protein ACK5QW_04200 [Cyanobacteriota bacterium]